MATVQQKPAAAVRQLTAQARLPMVTGAEMTTRIMLVTTPTTPTRTLKTVLAEALKAETQEITLMTTTARVAMGTVAMTITVAVAQQGAMIENRTDKPMATAGRIVEIATVTMMTMMMLAPLTMNST
jgi:MarR-like DNA-binding transcriptional regulator SgrR of sgrS sRNA